MTTLNVFRFITLSSAITFFVLGCFIHFKGRSSRFNRAFALWMIFCALWSVGFFLTMFGGLPHGVALWSSRLSHFFVGFTAILFLRFVILFLRMEMMWKAPHRLHSFLAVSAGVSSLTPWMITDVVPKLFFPYYPEAGPLYVSLLASYFYTYGAALFLLFRTCSNPLNGYLLRMQSLVIFVGTLFAWVGVATLFLLSYNFRVTPQLAFFPLIAVVTVYAILRYRFLDIRVVITRAGLLLGTYVIVLGTPFLVGWWGRVRLEGWLGRDWWLAPLGLCTALATAGPFAYAYLRRQTEARLLKEQRRYQRTLQLAARGMTRVRNVSKLANLITRIVSKTVGVTHASLFLWDKIHERYVLRASHGPRRLALQSRYGLEVSHPLIRWLEDHRRVLVVIGSLEPLERSLAEVLVQVDATLIVPGLVEHRLVGFLALGPKLSRAAYSSDDLHAFSTLANEAAIAVENAEFYEELMRANEHLKATSDRLLIQERLAAAGQFAMGVAHEVKNPLSSIKTFAQYLPERYKDPVFRKKFFRIVQLEIDRINEIVKDLSDFAKPAPLELQPVRIAELVEDTLSLLSNQCLDLKVDVHKSFAENGTTIQADPQQLKQVILNLLINSLEASQVGDRIDVITRTNGRFLTLRIVDTGCGISPEDQKRIWDPFFTTKERGMGLGLAIVKGVVERHGGQITLASVPGKGTTIELSLPLTP